MRASLLLLLLFVALQSTAQKIYLPKNLSVNDSSLFKAMPVMAQEVIRYYKADNKKDYFDNLFRYQLAAHQYQNAILFLDSSYYYYEGKMPTTNNTVNFQFRSYAIAQQAELSNNKPFIQIYTDTLAAIFSRLSDDQKNIAARYFTIDTNTLRKNLKTILAKVTTQDSINLVQARTLVRTYNAWNVFKKIFQPGRAFFAKEDAKKYIIIDSLLLTMHDGGKISAVIVRNRSIMGPQ
ncbi:MAG: hypothetical protein ABIN25_02265, partial [Ginsengibacter sp.]